MTFRLETDRWGRIHVKLAKPSSTDKTSSNLHLYVVFEQNADGGERSVQSGFLSTWTNKQGRAHVQGRTTETEVGKHRGAWNAAKIEAIGEELRRIPSRFKITLHTLDSDLLAINGRGKFSDLAKAFDEVTAGRSVKLVSGSVQDSEYAVIERMLAKNGNREEMNDHAGTRMRRSSTFQPRMVG